MVKLTLFPVLFATSMLTLAGCSKDEASPEPEHPEPSTAEPSHGGGEMPPEGEPAGAEPSAGMKQPEAGEATSAKSAPGEPSAEPKIKAFSDGQIVQITATIDAGEIEQAKLAKQKAKSPLVKQFAGEMITQHTQSKQKGAELAAQQQISPMDSSLEDDLEAGSMQMMKSLTKAKGPEFDRLYIEGQVDQHAKALSLIETQLIPSAANETLRSRLVDTRMMVSNHLAQAKDIQTQLMK